MSRYRRLSLIDARLLRLLSSENPELHFTRAELWGWKLGFFLSVGRTRHLHKRGVL
jgi:hypothetical protein